MGANNSTAVTCSASSLDLSGGGHYYRSSSQQGTSAAIMAARAKQSAKTNHISDKSQRQNLEHSSPNNMRQLKQANSYFDLTNDHLLSNRFSGELPLRISKRLSYSNNHNGNSSGNNRNSASYLDSSDPSEAYSISNANIGCSRPIKVLPSQPIVKASQQNMLLAQRSASPRDVLRRIPNQSHLMNGGGVANKMQRRQNQQRFNELKKFSDSLPSLVMPSNDLASPYSPYSAEVNAKAHPRYVAQNRQALKKVVGQEQSSRKILESSPITVCNYHRESKLSPNEYIKSNMKHPHFNHQQHQILVRTNNDKFRDHQFSHYKLDNNSNELRGPNSPLVRSRNNNDARNEQLIKRATSLSALHNSHSHLSSKVHPKQLMYQKQEHIRDQQVNYYHSNGDNHCKLKQQLKVSPQQQQQQQQQHQYSHEKFKLVNSGDIVSKQQQTINNKYTSHDLPLQQQQQQALSKRSISQFKQQQYNQGTPLSRKILKLKQGALSKGKANRTRSNQTAIAQQQGCPVLPPLPRSQSLHELIQLRSTENGQRMRTTGTLRGPLNNGQPDSDGINKVNLVAELLENRRKLQEQRDDDRKLNGCNLASDDNEQGLKQDISVAIKCDKDNNENTIVSVASTSSDDGIHDISLAAGDNHFDDLRVAPQASSENEVKRTYKRHEVVANLKPKKFSNCLQISKNVRPTSRQLSIGDDKNEHSSEANVATSTLRRSISHSALDGDIRFNSNNNPGSLNGDDGDESDDLNELAKFLYQFKQRNQKSGQTKNISGKINSSECNRFVGDPNIQARGEVDIPKEYHLRGQEKKNIDKQNGSHNQQSPNSTTSSSGFASSTCTSNSIYSSNSVELSGSNRAHVLRCSVSPHDLSKSSPDKQRPTKSSSNKKYPAPQVPKFDGQQELGGNNLKSVPSKNPISGQLKLSSSLLSIVDEYNATLQSNDSLNGVEISSIGAKCDSRLASVLMGVEKRSSTRELSKKSKIDVSLPHIAAPDSLVFEQQHYEQLKRYTKLRQMSQSELAINQLASADDHSGGSKFAIGDGLKRASKVYSSALSRSKSNDPQEQNRASRTKPYKSRLINLIKRISEKSDASRCAAGGRGAEVAGVSAKSWRPNQEFQGNNNYGNSREFDDRQTQHESAEQLCLRLGQTQQVEGAINQSSPFHSSPVAVVPERDGSRKKVGAPRESAHDPLSLEAFPLGARLNSASLCDLNFDCDLELIKKCSSASAAAHNEHTRHSSTSQAKATISANVSSSLSVSLGANMTQQPTGDSQPTRELCASGKVASGANLGTQMIGNAKGRFVSSGSPARLEATASKSTAATSISTVITTNATATTNSAACGELADANWRLVSSEGAREFASELAGHSKQSKLAALRGFSGKKSSQKESAASNSGLQSRDQPQAQKARRLAGGWLMSSRQQPSKLQQLPQKQQGRPTPGEASSSGQNCITKLIAGQRQTTHADKRPEAVDVDVAKPANCDEQLARKLPSSAGERLDETAIERQHLSSEANQLLDELEHSLDVEHDKLAKSSPVIQGEHSGPFSRKVALTWLRKSSCGDNVVARTKNQLALGRNRKATSDGRLLESSSSCESLNCELDLVGQPPIVNSAATGDCRDGNLAACRRHDRYLETNDGYDYAMGRTNEVTQRKHQQNHDDQSYKLKCDRDKRIEHDDDDDNDNGDDDDEDDYNDYAVINQAMINATFDVDIDNLGVNARLHKRPVDEVASPSNSFTFEKEAVSPASSSGQRLESAGKTEKAVDTIQNDRPARSYIRDKRHICGGKGNCCVEATRCCSNINGKQDANLVPHLPLSMCQSVDAGRGSLNCELDKNKQMNSATAGCKDCKSDTTKPSRSKESPREFGAQVCTPRIASEALNGAKQQPRGFHCDHSSEFQSQKEQKEVDGSARRPNLGGVDECCHRKLPSGQTKGRQLYGENCHSECCCRHNFDDVASRRSCLLAGQTDDSASKKVCNSCKGEPKPDHSSQHSRFSGSTESNDDKRVTPREKSSDKNAVAIRATDLHDNGWHSNAERSSCVSCLSGLHQLRHDLCGCGASSKRPGSVVSCFCCNTSGNCNSNKCDPTQAAVLSGKLIIQPKAPSCHCLSAAKEQPTGASKEATLALPVDVCAYEASPKAQPDIEVSQVASWGSCASTSAGFASEAAGNINGKARKFTREESISAEQLRGAASSSHSIHEAGRTDIVSKQNQAADKAGKLSRRPVANAGQSLVINGTNPCCKLNCCSISGEQPISDADIPTMNVATCKGPLHSLITRGQTEVSPAKVRDNRRPISSANYSDNKNLHLVPSANYQLECEAAERLASLGNVAIAPQNLLAENSRCSKKTASKIGVPNCVDPSSALQLQVNCCGQLCCVANLHVIEESSKKSHLGESANPLIVSHSRCMVEPTGSEVPEAPSVMATKQNLSAALTVFRSSAFLHANEVSRELLSSGANPKGERKRISAENSGQAALSSYKCSAVIPAENLPSVTPLINTTNERNNLDGDAGSKGLEHFQSRGLEQQKQQRLIRDVQTDFDDNFILRRKTPNAGLKTHC